MTNYKDKYGRIWQLPKNELCPVCGQPDNCGDCQHERLKNSEVEILDGYIKNLAV